MKKLFMAVIALMMTISASAQFYIYLSDGTVAKVDSISMVAPSYDEIPGIGTFSVSADKQVTFSQGNLQYHPANDEWRFAENQTDYIGEDNSYISDTYNGWLDLFGWSTATTNFGVSTSTASSDYSGSFVDWGTNKIGNDAPNTWRTLTKYEWRYLIFYRTNADDLVGLAQVNGVKGLVFLPNNWNCPAGVTFKSGFYSNQTFTTAEWALLESAGAVFLPAAGYSDGSDVGIVHGDYWSASESSSSHAGCLSFHLTGANVNDDPRDDGKSVRLVKDL